MSGLDSTSVDSSSVSANTINVLAIWVLSMLRNLLTSSILCWLGVATSVDCMVASGRLSTGARASAISTLAAKLLSVEKAMSSSPESANT